MIEVKKAGYKSYFHRTNSIKLSSLGLADAIAGSVILLPLLGLMFPGAWEQDPSVLGVSLEPRAQGGFIESQDN